MSGTPDVSMLKSQNGNSIEICAAYNSGMTRVDRRTVDLSAYPDLMVIILGMRVNALTG